MNYFENYRKMLNRALYTIDEFQILNMKTHLINMAKHGTPLLVCGNGGSAAITEHLSCDHTKGIACDTDLKPFVIPLQSNVSLNTAIANDIGFSKVFSEQIKWFSNKFDLLVVSSSGNSPNIINAVKLLNKKGRLLWLWLDLMVVRLKIWWTYVFMYIAIIMVSLKIATKSLCILWRSLYVLSIKITAI